LYLAFLTVVRAGFSDDQVPTSPDILLRLMTSAREDLGALIASFRESGDPPDAFYYLRSVDYIGASDGVSGVVHVAHFTLTRSASPDGKRLASDHDLVVFFDSSLRLHHHHWRFQGAPEGRFHIADKKLYLGDRELLDFARTPMTGTTIIDMTPPERK
jgi:hypothetical protein